MMSYHRFFLICGLFSLLAIFASCGSDVTGCTDPMAINYNPDADASDGSCTYERDQFLGIYDVQEECLSFMAGYELTVSASDSEVDQVLLTNIYDTSVITGTVDGDDISFDASADGLNYVGLASILGDSLILNYSVVNESGAMDNCTGLGMKQ